MNQEKDRIESARKNGESLYEYNFSIWINDECNSDELTESLRLMPRIIMIFTENQFRNFRMGLSSAGFIMVEICRRPYFEDETVL